MLRIANALALANGLVIAGRQLITFGELAGHPLYQHAILRLVTYAFVASGVVGLLFALVVARHGRRAEGIAALLSLPISVLVGSLMLNAYFGWGTVSMIVGELFTTTLVQSLPLIVISAPLAWALMRFSLRGETGDLRQRLAAARPREVTEEGTVHA